MPAKGNILIYRFLKGGALSLLCSHQARSGVMSLCQCQNCLVAAVLSTLSAYSVHVETQPDTSEIAGLQLQNVANVKCNKAVLFTEVSAEGNTIVASDLTASFAQYMLVNNVFTETYLRPQPFWPHSSLIQGEHVLAATGRELISVRLDAEGKTVKVSDKLCLGQRVNKIISAELATSTFGDTTNTLSKVFVEETPRTCVYATGLGALGIVARITPYAYGCLEGLQRTMRDLGIVGTESQTDKKGETEGSRFINGDLVERFLDLQPEMSQKVYQASIAGRDHIISPSWREVTVLLRLLSILH